MRSKANKGSKLLQITRAPIRVLCKARDLYVKGMLDFAGSGKVGYGRVGGGVDHLPKSFSVNSSSRAVQEDEELKKELLLRLMSRRGIGEVETYVQRMQRDGGVKRSYSVGVGKIGRIDEDKACSFREDESDVQGNLCGRSRSHAVRRKIVYN